MTSSTEGKRFDLTVIPPSSVLSRSAASGGSHPIPARLKQDLAVVTWRAPNGIEFTIECITPEFQQDNDYRAYRASLLQSGIDKEKFKRVTLSRLDISSLYERAEKANEGKIIRLEEDNIADSARNFFYGVIEHAKKNDISDVHFIVRRNGCQILYRMFSTMVRVSNHAYDMLNGVISVIYNKDADTGSTSDPNFSPKLKSQCSITIAKQQIKLRWQTVPLNYDDEYDIVVRLIPMGGTSTVRSLSSLGYLPDQCSILESAARTPKGGIFMAGVTGSGKSTTLRTLMQIAAEGGARKLYSVEDPIEGRIFGVSQIAIQRSSNREGVSSSPFAEALKMLMRADPDVIMCGELRDRETAGAAEEIIRTGHQMMTTVHAGSAFGILGRLSSETMGIPRDVLAEPEFLSLLIYQHLVPVLCDCKIPIMDVSSNNDIEMVIHHLNDPARFGMDISNMYVKNNDGCAKCRSKLPGVSGMTVCAEIVEPEFDILQLIYEGRIMDAMLAWRGRRSSGFDEPGTIGKTAAEVALYKVSQGMIDPRDVETTFEPFSRMKILRDA